MANDINALKTEEAKSTWPFKRIVVDVDEEGKSYVVTQEISSVIMRPGFFHRADLWCTKETPVDNSIPGDRALDLVTRDPFAGGVNCRELVMFSEVGADNEARIAQNRDLHERVQQKHMPSAEDYKRHPSMHRTDSVDLISVATGEIYIMTDEDEVLMKPGDSVVIRGVNHAWSNRGTEPCALIGGMVSASEYELYSMEPIEVDVENASDEVKNWPFKRVVLGCNDKGKSYTMTTQVSRVFKQDSGCTVADLWSLKEVPGNNTIEGDRALDLETLEPFPGGVVFRTVVVEPESTGCQPEMIQMDTLDFAFVAKGEIYLVTDTEEILMKPGDGAIIKGARHTWRNRSEEPCVLNGYLTDALPR